jgi:hypothetical protein
MTSITKTRVEVRPTIWAWGLWVRAAGSEGRHCATSFSWSAGGSAHKALGATGGWPSPDLPAALNDAMSSGPCARSSRVPRRHADRELPGLDAVRLNKAIVRRAGFIRTMRCADRIEQSRKNNTHAEIDCDCIERGITGYGEGARDKRKIADWKCAVAAIKVPETIPAAHNARPRELAQVEPLVRLSRPPYPSRGRWNRAPTQTHRGGFSAEARSGR